MGNDANIDRRKYYSDKVTSRCLESRNHYITFNGNVSNNPLVFKTINVDSYVSFFYVKRSWSPSSSHLKVKIAWHILLCMSE